MGVSSSLISTPANGPSAATIGLRGTKKTPGCSFISIRALCLAQWGFFQGVPEKKQRQERNAG